MFRICRVSVYKLKNNHHYCLAKERILHRINSIIHQASTYSMPIRAEHRALYPDDWPQLSASIRFDRAKGRCEGCGRPHGKLVLCIGDGRWFDRQDGSWRDERGCRTFRPQKPYRLRWTVVRLAACHLDHDPTNSSFGNLKAWCQRCHLLHDRPEHRRRAAITVLLRRALGDLFLGPYRL